MNLYQVCLNGGPEVRNGPAAEGGGDLGFRNEIYFKIFFSRTAWLRCLKFGSSSEPLGLEMLEICYVALHNGPLPSLFK